MRYWKIGLTAGACAVCCAPLLAPFFIGSAFVGASAAGFWALWSVEASTIAFAMGLMGVWFFWRRRKSAHLADASKKCGCAPNARCNTGSACEVPQPKGADRPAISATAIPTP